MKLNVRLILISFIIVLVISVSSMGIYYSLAGSLVSKQQNKAILNAANDFVFSFENILQKPEDDFNGIVDRLSNINKINLDSTNLDFIFTLVGDSLINFNEYTAKQNSFINTQSKSFKDFFKNNPNVILQYHQFAGGKNVFFGSLITSVLLDSLAQNIHAEVALVIDDSPVDISNSLKNQKYLFNLVNAERFLKFKNNFDLYEEELENTDFVATYYSPRQILTPGGKINFIVFGAFEESAELKSTLKNVAIIITLAGSALSIIFVLLFTTKLRKQISLLSEAVEFTRGGNLDHRVPIILKDEVGKLGEAFNDMLNEIKKNKNSEKEYAEFIAMINQNPTLQEISDAALSKIIKATGLTFGVFYTVEEKNAKVISSFGIGKNSILPDRQSEFYSNAIEKHEVVEFEFHENFPEIKTGLALIKIKYLIVYPVFYNKETIAIIELASESFPHSKVRSYIDGIHDQLAIGLNNARSLDQLENLVKELKELNEEYHKQNLQIIEQNEKQKELHQQLEEKAVELETQRVKAVELSKVKSQFLASMSHELRTPLISILGLTELMGKDSLANYKFKERLDIVYRNGKKLLSMITNILEFSKFDNGKIELKKESFLFDDLLNEILPGIKLIVDEKQLLFQVIKEPNVNLVLNTDRTKLEQVLNNLLVNAVKFTEHGTITLKIILHGNRKLEFSVCDTGIGIPEQDREIIFSEFRQLDSGMTRKFGGVGLGLAICKRYIELLGSELKLESKVNSGSCLSFILDDCVLDVFDPAEIVADNSLQTVKTVTGKNVLLVTDNSDMEKLFADYLTDNKIGVSWTPAYKKAIELIKNSTFESIIVTPLKDENVWSFINEAKKLPTERLKILITNIIEEDKSGWLLNVEDFISKGSVPAVLLKSISAYEKSSGSKISEINFVSSSVNEYENYNAILHAKYLVNHFKSAESLYNRIATEIPDLILIDLETIKSDTLEIFLKIKLNETTGDVPVLFLLPKIFPDDLASELNRKLYSIAKNFGGNLLNILKEIAKQIGSSALSSKEKQYVDNQVESIEVASNVESSSNQLSKPTILIVDDDSDSLFTIGEFVKELDYEAIFAHNGTECLITLNHMEPDLILLDIMMPQMDGFETIKRIRADKKFSKLPVLALTAYAMLENKNVIEKNGFDDLITKPVNLKNLASKINENLKMKANV